MHECSGGDRPPTGSIAPADLVHRSNPNVGAAVVDVQGLWRDYDRWTGSNDKVRLHEGLRLTSCAWLSKLFLILGW